MTVGKNSASGLSAVSNSSVYGCPQLHTDYRNVIYDVKRFCASLASLHKIDLCGWFPGYFKDAVLCQLFYMDLKLDLAL
jgi:hypothetical protein